MNESYLSVSPPLVSVALVVCVCVRVSVCVFLCNKFWRMGFKDAKNVFVIRVRVRECH